MTVTLYDNDSGDRLGTISDEQLQFLIDQLEEEDSDDQDYWLRKETLDFLEEEGADEQLMNVLRRGLGDKKGFEIRWERD